MYGIERREDEREDGEGESKAERGRVGDEDTSFHINIACIFYHAENATKSTATQGSGMIECTCQSTLHIVSEVAMKLAILIHIYRFT